MHSSLAVCSQVLGTVESTQLCGRCSKHCAPEGRRRTFVSGQAQQIFFLGFSGVTLCFLLPENQENKPIPKPGTHKTTVEVRDRAE